jgi:hypothetical protein
MSSLRYANISTEKAWLMRSLPNPQQNEVASAQCHWTTKNNQENDHDQSLPTRRRPYLQSQHHAQDQPLVDGGHHRQINS